MDAIEQHFHVGFHYPVHFTRHLFAPANRLLADVVRHGGRPADIVVIVDDGVALAHRTLLTDIAAYAARHADALRLAARVLVVQGGEDSKTDRRHLDAILERIHDARLCRHSSVIAVGGGAVLDVAGYAAATAHRGVRLIRVPTTVLAQADSGVGVKNGVNAFGLKNYLGVFAPPFAVINDASFLPTLSDRDWRGGVAEAVKVALVKDPAFFDDLERDAAAIVGRDAAVMDHVIRRSAALHLSHIAAGGDPFEAGTSRPLDFGHWAAHKLESLTNGGLRHGEAVAIGMALDTTYARDRGVITEGDWRRVIGLIAALGLPLFAPALEAADQDAPVLRGLEEFREHLGGVLTIMLPTGIGRTLDVHAIETDAMIRSIAALKTLDADRPARGAVRTHAGSASGQGA